jgi:hypothetical protein
VGGAAAEDASAVGCSHDLYLWDDSQIQPGDKWRDEIKTVFVATKVALFLGSMDFLVSKFVTYS